MPTTPLESGLGWLAPLYSSHGYPGGYHQKYHFLATRTSAINLKNTGTVHEVHNAYFNKHPPPIYPHSALLISEIDSGSLETSNYTHIAPINLK